MPHSPSGIVPVDSADGDVAGGGDICNDGNVCTNDSVNPSGGCVYSFNHSSCNDNNACTANDQCNSGLCRGTNINCNDNNVCTNDSCTPSSGCVHVNNSGICDDGVFCNGTETCTGGVCGLSSGNPCPPNAICDEAARRCDSSANNSIISFKAVKINDVPLTPGVCNLAATPPRCSTGNVNRPCSSDAECHVGTSYLTPNRCAGGTNINNVCASNAGCPGSTCITVLAGDLIEAEIFLSRWTTDLPAGVRTFQVKTDKSGFVGFDNGTALPVGWCAPVNSIACLEASSCPVIYPICSSLYGCTCAGHDPELGAYITMSRRDFLFHGLGGIFIVDTSSLSIRYTGIADFGTVQDIGVPRYLGSFVMQVSANACGAFAIGFVEQMDSTYIADSANPPNHILPALQPLYVTISDCSRQLLFCSPDHGHLDARIPHDRLDAEAKLTTNKIDLNFSESTLEPAGMVAADFEVTLVPILTGDVVPSISSITPDAFDPKKTTIVFDRHIQQKRWTCILDKGSNKRCCVGSLPGDADANRVSQPDDVFEIYDNLQGIVAPALGIEKCDVDRSMRCTGADLLMLVDLLMGADAFNEVSGDSLQLCPDMRPPP